MISSTVEDVPLINMICCSVHQREGKDEKGWANRSKVVVAISVFLKKKGLKMTQS